MLRTAAAMRALGATLARGADGAWRIDGVGIGGLAEPDDVLDLGNSGTGARLLMGLVAGHDITAFFTGDASLRRRPMARVTEPLSRMGARIVAREGGRLPLARDRRRRAAADRISPPGAVGAGQVGRPAGGAERAGRDHRDRATGDTRPYRAHAAPFRRRRDGRARAATAVDASPLQGQPELRAADLTVPGDPSSAAFPMVAALLLPGSQVVIEGVGVNPLRTGLFDTLREMGADIAFTNERVEGGEPVADLAVRAARLQRRRGAGRARAAHDRRVSRSSRSPPPSPRAHGDARPRRAARQGERPARRHRARAAACGVKLAMSGETLVVEGADAPPAGGASIATKLDHRIAMAFLVLGMAARAAGRGSTTARTIDTSFPGFVALMNGLGATIAPVAP